MDWLESWKFMEKQWRNPVKWMHGIQCQLSMIVAFICSSLIALHFCTFWNTWYSFSPFEHACRHISSSPLRAVPEHLKWPVRASKGKIAWLMQEKVWDFSSAHSGGALYRPHSRLIPVQSACVLAAVKLLSDDTSTQGAANGRGA